MARFLITGGAGFIGCHFARRRIAAGAEDRLVVLDALTYAGHPANLDPLRDHPGFRFVRGDVRDRELVEELLRAEAIDTLVHFAAESHVDRSIDGPRRFVEVNVGGTQALLDAAREVWLEEGSGGGGCRFHQISTDEVYGDLGPEDPPFTEATPYAPNSPYAASKAAADHLVHAYHRTYGLPVSISNCPNNYGPRQFPEKLVSLSIVNLLLGRELPVYGDGSNVREWLHVEDHCRGIELVLERGEPGETYNLGGGSELSNLEVVRAVCGAVDALFAERREAAERYPECPAAAGSGCRELIRFVDDRPGHDRRYALDGSRAAQRLGFGPRIAFADGLRATVAWYADHREWWESVMDESYRRWVERWYRSGEKGGAGSA